MGRRGAAQTAVLFAGLGTLACGLSTSMEMLIVSRFVGPSTLVVTDFEFISGEQIAGMGGGGVNTIAT